MGAGRSGDKTRRHALIGSAALVGGAVASLSARGGFARAASPPMPPPAAVARKRSANDVVELGKTGIKLSRLAMGTGTHGFNKASDQTRGLGVDGLGAFLVQGYDRGLTFWDTADGYGSHPHVAAGLKRLGKARKNDVVLLTKTRARTKQEMAADLDRFRREIGRDHLDVVLLHCMTSANWPAERAGAMEVLERAREKGIVRAHGVSCHSLEALEAAAATPWVQVDLARINPIGAHMDADPKTVIDVLSKMKRAGKAVIGMKILAQGDLGNDVEGALRFASRLDCLDAFTIGFTSEAQRKQVVDTLPVVSISG